VKGVACFEQGMHNCFSCKAGYSLTNNATWHGDKSVSKHKRAKDINRCAKNVCTCRHGTPATGAKCTKHNKNICEKCDQIGPRSEWWIKAPGKWGPECIKRPCNDCVPECNRQMDQNAWLIKMDLQTSGMTLGLPKALHNAIGGILPIRNVTLYSVGYSGLADADAMGAKARAFSDKLNQIKKMISDITKRAADAALKVAKATNNTKLLKAAESAKKTGKPPGLAQILGLIGMNETSAQKECRANTP
jgi:hypothetical protein